MPHTGILDTSVAIDLPVISGDLLPPRSAITSVTPAELAAGPHATTDPIQRAIRQQRLQWAEATFDALPFDVGAARSYGHVYALVVTADRKPRGRLGDLLIAWIVWIAAAHRLPLSARNPADSTRLESVVTVVPV